MRITSTYVENTVGARCAVNTNLGSPPHTWRIHFVIKRISVAIGITSTYVENTTDYTKVPHPA